MLAPVRDGAVTTSIVFLNSLLTFFLKVLAGHALEI